MKGCQRSRSKWKSPKTDVAPLKELSSASKNVIDCRTPTSIWSVKK
jgi:hypothetical protein